MAMPSQGNFEGPLDLVEFAKKVTMVVQIVWIGIWSISQRV
jgi:hypothetical protein